MKKALLFAFVISLLGCCPVTLFSQKNKTFDQYIDEGFAPIGHFFYDIVFFSPTIKDDIVYKEVGQPRQKTDFYEYLPFDISFEKAGNHIPYGQVIQISYAAADSFRFTGTLEGNEYDDIFAYQKNPYQIGNFTFRLTYHPESPYPMEPGRIYTFKPVIFKLPPIPILLLIGIALFFTINFGFINFGKFRLAWGILRNQYVDRYGRSPLTHFQALSTALSGSLGLGNIAGVGVAMAIGGPGAAFWMIVAGILAMAVKFSSTTLSIRYREYDTKGISYGGPMYYLQKGMEEKGWKVFGKVLAISFAVLCIGAAWGIGNMYQINQATQQMIHMAGDFSPIVEQFRWVSGLVFGGLLVYILLGGIRRIGWLTERLVPFMSLLYIIGTLWVIGTHISELPAALWDMIKGAFLPVSVAGGVIGSMIQGFSAAIFSNETGLGSSSMAHSSAGARDAASQGLVSMLEPFIDTVLICTLTALTIATSGVHYKMSPENGLQMAAAAFRNSLPLSDYIFGLIVILFACSSMIAWAYYGLKAWEYLLGKDKRVKIAYFVLYGMFVVLGSIASFASIIAFSKAMMFAMTVPHIIGLVILTPQVRTELTKYVTKLQRGDIKRKK